MWAVSSAFMCNSVHRVRGRLLWFSSRNAASIGLQIGKPGSALTVGRTQLLDLPLQLWVMGRSLTWFCGPWGQTSELELSVVPAGSLLCDPSLHLVGKAIAPCANCLPLACCLPWPLCQVHTVLGLVLLPGAATCCVRDKPLLLNVPATWSVGLPRVTADEGSQPWIHNPKKGPALCSFST